MEAFQYWRKVLAITRKETLSHFRRKVLLGFCMSVGATILQFWMHVRVLTDTEKILVSLAASATAVMLGSFLKHLLLTPPALAHNSALDVSTLRQQVEQLKPPKRTPEQEQKYSEAKTALDEIGIKAIPVLRHLDKHGPLKFNGLDPPLPKGMSARDTRAILNICADHDIVTRVPSIRPSGGVSPIMEDTYSIPIGIADVLRELLYPPRTL